MLKAHLFYANRYVLHKKPRKNYFCWRYTIVIFCLAHVFLRWIMKIAFLNRSITLRRAPAETDFFLRLYLNVINNCYDIGNNVWKFHVSTMKIVPVARIWSSCVIRIMMTHHFRKGANKLTNLCEIRLFHIV